MFSLCSGAAAAVMKPQLQALTSLKHYCTGTQHVKNFKHIPALRLCLVPRLAWGGAGEGGGWQVLVFMTRKYKTLIRLRAVESRAVVAPPATVAQSVITRPAVDQRDGPENKPREGFHSSLLTSPTSCWAGPSWTQICWRLFYFF